MRVLENIRLIWCIWHHDLRISFLQTDCKKMICRFTISSFIVVYQRKYPGNFVKTSGKSREISRKCSGILPPTPLEQSEPVNLQISSEWWWLLSPALFQYPWRHREQPLYFPYLLSLIYLLIILLVTMSLVTYRVHSLKCRAYYSPSSHSDLLSSCSLTLVVNGWWPSRILFKSRSLPNATPMGVTDTWSSSKSCIPFGRNICFTACV